VSDKITRIFPDNEFGDIDAKKPGKFAPKSIVHYMLNVESLPGVGLKFEAIRKNEVFTPDFIAKYAEDIANDPSGPASFVGSPYDMEVSHGCWLLVQLNPLINWQFAPGGRGCTTKKKANSRNCLLHHVYRGGVVKGPGEDLDLDVDIHSDDKKCRVLYFYVAKRGGKNGGHPSNPPGDLFNFHIEFFQVGSDGGKRLAVIFDPDVKNNSEIPIPPDEPGGLVHQAADEVTIDRR
jgi:hypothetical protein